MDSARFERKTDEYFCDFILSIGSDCGPALNLRFNSMRYFSAPLDWMMDYSLSTVLHLFKDGFNDFFSQYEIDKNDPEGSMGMLRVNDTLNHIVSIHHFPGNMSIDSYYPQFIEKMNSRKDRLEALLHNASGIVLAAERTDPKEDLLSFLRSFSKLYPHLRIRLINLRFDENMSYNTYKQETVFDDNILSYIDYTYNTTQHGVRIQEDYFAIWSRILSKISLIDSHLNLAHANE